MNTPAPGRTPFFFAAALLGLAFSNPLAAAADAALEQTRSGDVPANLRAVKIEHRSGAVTVIGVDSNYGWNWKLDGFDDPATAAAYIKATELKVQEIDGRLSFQLLLPNSDTIRNGNSTRRYGSFFGIINWSYTSSNSSNSVRSTLELRVPRPVAVELANRFGPVTVSGVEGRVDLDCRNARIDLSNTPGLVSASTSFAAIDADRIGSARLRNQNGTIDVTRASGELSAATSFARLQVEDIKGRADLRNQNGAITAIGVDGPLDATTSFARLEVRDISGRAELNNRNGAINARRLLSDVFATTSFSEMTVEDVTGSATVRSQNGRIEVLRVGGSVTAATSFGSMRIEDVQGNAVLDSRNGSITTAGIQGSVRAKTSFAQIRLDGTSKDIEAENQNGGIEIMARSRDLTRISADTSFGSINLSLPDSTKPLIRADTSFGKVHSDFPVVLSSTLSEEKFNADPTQPKILLHGRNGDIRIRLL